MSLFDTLLEYKRLKTTRHDYLMIIMKYLTTVFSLSVLHGNVKIKKVINLMELKM